MSSSVVTLDNFLAFLVVQKWLKKNTKKLIDNYKIPIPIANPSNFIQRGYESSGPGRDLENAHIFVLSSGLAGHRIMDRSGLAQGLASVFDSECVSKKV